MDSKAGWHKLSEYMSSPWNKFDQIANILFIASVILRLSLSDEYFIWARMLYTVTLTLYFIRFLQFFFVDMNMGPKVVMVRRMVSRCGSGSYAYNAGQCLATSKFERSQIFLWRPVATGCGEKSAGIARCHLWTALHRTARSCSISNLWRRHRTLLQANRIARFIFSVLLLTNRIERLKFFILLY